jgi:hypothetical protein
VKKRTLTRAALAAVVALVPALAAATVVGCAAISGLDQLEEQACAPNCGDAVVDTHGEVSIDAADTAIDTTIPETAVDAAEAGDAADAAEVADASDAADAADAADTRDAADTNVGDSACGPLNVVTNCSACGVVCDVTNSNGRVCDGMSCQYSGCKAGWADCVSAAPDQDGCETPTTTLSNCGGCGNACDTVNSLGRSCDGASCNYTGCKADFADCNKAAPNADGCETNIKTSKLNCTACGVKCDVLHSVGPTCDGTTCNYNSCFSGFSDCDKTAPNANGCECPTPACCGSSCAVAHKNCVSGTCGPLGQNYFIANACQALGTPGNPATYTQEMAVAARAAWPQAGTDDVPGTGSCGGQSALSRVTATACVVWVYAGSLAGSVFYSTTMSDAGGPACLCPGSTATSWN